MKLNIIIYTTSKDTWFLKNIPFISEKISEAKGVELGEIHTEYIQPTDVKVVVDNEGHTRIDWEWFRSKFASDPKFNAVCFHFSKKERNKWGISQNLGGFYYVNEGDSTLDFCVIADKGAKAKGKINISDQTYTINYEFDEFTRLFLHELSHGFEHWTHGVPNMVTHYYDYVLSRIQNVYKQEHTFEKWNLLNETLRIIKNFMGLNTKTNAEKLYDIALKNLGIDASPADLAPDELGCAETVSNLIKKVLPNFPIVTGTWTLYDVLEHHPQFKKLEIPTRGCIAICATLPGKPFPGHTWIVGENDVWMSNDSRKEVLGKFLTNYTRSSAFQRYVTKGKYQMRFYLPI